MKLDQRVELDGALRGFTITSNDGHDLGEVSEGSADHTLLLVTGQRKLLGRSPRYAIPRATLDDLDLDTMTITIRATRAQVEAAPAFQDDGPQSSIELERYYSDLEASR